MISHFRKHILTRNHGQAAMYSLQKGQVGVRRQVGQVGGKSGSGASRGGKSGSGQVGVRSPILTRGKPTHPGNPRKSNFPSAFCWTAEWFPCFSPLSTKSLSTETLPSAQPNAANASNAANRANASNLSNAANATNAVIVQFPITCYICAMTTGTTLSQPVVSQSNLRRAFPH